MLRLVLAMTAAAVTGALGALILGEYPFKGVTVLGSALVFGLLVAEAALTIHSTKGPALATACTVAAAGGMTWAAWIASGHDLSYLGPAGWAAIPLAAVAAGGWTFRTWWSRPAPDSPAPEPAPAAAPPDPSS